MSRIVRQSKFRHVFGQPVKSDLCYNGTKITRTAWDSNLCAASTKAFAMSWESQGGGVFAVIQNENTGKLAEVPLVTGHKGPVLDLEFNPFNENLIASASEDCYIKIWNIPEGGLKENMTESAQTLSGHKRKVGGIQFHPCANNVLASIGADLFLKIWDIEKGEEMFSIGEHTDISASVAWNKDGSLIATGCKDKKLRIIDPRDNKVVKEYTAHTGSKGMRVLWMNDKVFTVGVSRSSDREFAIWDPKGEGEEPVTRVTYDNANGSIMPFYDNDTSLLFLAGKGDGTIRYYEVTDEKPFVYLLSEYKSSSPQIGMAMVPKRGVNVSSCEIVKLLKVTRDKVEPISFTVPRKSDIFQEDLFPPCYSGVSVLTAEAWKNGENKDPDCTFDLSPGFVQPERKVEEFKPVVKEEEKPKTEKELKEENEALQKRVAYLETELRKKEEQLKALEKTE